MLCIIMNFCFCFAFCGLTSSTGLRLPLHFHFPLSTVSHASWAGKNVRAEPHPSKFQISINRISFFKFLHLLLSIAYFCEEWLLEAVQHFSKMKILRWREMPGEWSEHGGIEARRLKHFSYVFSIMANCRPEDGIGMWLGCLCRCAKSNLLILFLFPVALTVLHLMADMCI